MWDSWLLAFETEHRPINPVWEYQENTKYRRPHVDFADSDQKRQTDLSDFTMHSLKWLQIHQILISDRLCSFFWVVCIKFWWSSAVLVFRASSVRRQGGKYYHPKFKADGRESEMCHWKWQQTETQWRGHSRLLAFEAEHLNKSCIWWWSLCSGFVKTKKQNKQPAEKALVGSWNHDMKIWRVKLPNNSRMLAFSTEQQRLSLFYFKTHYF